MQEFKFGRTSTNDEPRSGRLSDATAPKMIKKILLLVTDVGKLKVREIFKMVNISFNPPLPNIWGIPSVGSVFAK